MYLNKKCRYCKEVIEKTDNPSLNIRLHKICFVIIQNKIQKSQQLIQYVIDNDPFNISLLEFIKTQYKIYSKYLKVSPQMNDLIIQ
jgi:hypothetical protein